MVDELIDLIVEIMTLPDTPIVRIGGIEKNVALVKSQFMKLKKAHIEYVINCLEKIQKEPIQSDMISVLFG